MFEGLKGAALEAYHRLSPDLQGRLEKALNALSPIPFSLRLEGEARHILLHQDHINQSLTQFLDPDYLDELRVGIHPQGQVELVFKPKLWGRPSDPIHLALVLEEGVVGPQEAYLAFRMRGPRWSRVGSFAERLASWWLHQPFSLVHELGWWKAHTPSWVRVEGERLVLSLREEALNFMYDTTLAQAAGMSLPLYGHKKPIELIQVVGASTEEGVLKLKYNLSLML